MASHPIPDAALDDRLGFVGTSGSGKTYCAGTAVERLLARGARCVIVDPLDVWYGLRLKADGKAASPHKVVIFGGAHGDLPLNEHAGKLIGETVATMSESCIVSLGGLSTKAAERRFMLAFLETLYRQATGEPFHLIFDEADLWAPQKSSEPMLQNLMEQIVRRGRVKGFIPWLISQRPAVISKDVLSQVDGLIAFKLTASQDRDAVGAWIEGQADKQQGKQILASLPAMQRGQGVVWVPGRGILTTASFPAKHTFDSSRTPKRGEKVRSAALVPIDLGKLKERLAKVEAEVKASDPALLRRRIGELDAEIRRLKVTAPAPAAVDPAALDRARAAGEASAHAKFRNLGLLIRQAADRASGLLANLCAIADEIEAAKEPSAPPPAASITPKVVAHSPADPRATTAAAGGALPKGERICLIAVAQHAGGVTREQMTVLTGYKKSSRDAYIQRLRERGCIEVGPRISVTDQGVATLGPDYEPLPTGAALRDYWLDRLPEGERKVLSVLIQHHPHDVARSDIDNATGYKKSSRDAYLQRLSARELVTTGHGTARASDRLFEGGR